MGLQHVLVAVSDPEKVNDSLTRRRIQEGKVQRIGRGMSKDIERIIALSPDIYLQDLYSATERIRIWWHQGSILSTSITGRSRICSDEQNGLRS